MFRILAVLTILIGLIVFSLPEQNAIGQGKVPTGDHWRFHDGHWNLWNTADKRWYHTDGVHWYYNNGTENSAWVLYAFDGQFGKENVIREEYVIPAPEVRVKFAVPRHNFWRVVPKK